jgi:hypothetical protein
MERDRLVPLKNTKIPSDKLQGIMLQKLVYLHVFALWEKLGRETLVPSGLKVSHDLATESFSFS